jgi:hypothetical protein
MKNILISVGVWLALACIVGIILGHNDLIRLHWLSQRSTKTQGTVLAKEPQNHRLVDYEYTVGQRSFRGQDRVDEEAISFDSIQPRDHITIYFDSENPSYSVLGNPRMRYENEIRSVGAATVIFPILIVVILIWRGVLPKW